MMQNPRGLSGLAAAAALSLAQLTGPALAEGNLASKPVDLPELMLTGDLKMSQTEYQLETGKYYRIKISSDGQEEFAWFAPELFRNSWVNQVVVNDLEVKAGGIYSLEFDAAGTFTMTFVPIRPGKYDFYVDGYADKGMLGAFMVN
jgi:uncharacterized cupredoxin-like copper-binding protein